jgi:hypothetical protein
VDSEFAGYAWGLLGDVGCTLAIDAFLGDLTLSIETVRFLLIPGKVAFRRNYGLHQSERLVRRHIYTFLRTFPYHVLGD